VSRKAPLLSWLMLAVWASWLCAVHSLCVSRFGLVKWMPDLGLVFLVSCAARFEARQASAVALIVGLARVAYTIEPPSAVLAGFLMVGMGLRMAASVVEVSGTVLRGLYAALAVCLFSAWMTLVAVARGALPVEELSERLLGALPAAASSGLATLLLAPLFAVLPGLTPLRRGGPPARWRLRRHLPAVRRADARRSS